MRDNRFIRSKLSIISLLILIQLVAACDFSSELHNSILRAQDLVNSRSYSEAAKYYEDILKQNPTADIKLKVSYQLGELYSTYLGDYQKAIVHFSNVKKYSQDPLWSVRAEEKIGEICFVYLKDFGCAVNSYKKLANITPKLKLVDFYQYRLGVSYLKSDKIVDGSRVLSEISRQRKHEYYLPSQYELGLMEFHQKRWNEAIMHWRLYLNSATKREDVVRVKFMIANAYEMLEELKLAYDIYYSILGDFPNPKVIKERLNSIYARKVARRR